MADPPSIRPCLLFNFLKDSLTAQIFRLVLLLSHYAFCFSQEPNIF